MNRIDLVYWVWLGIVDIYPRSPSSRAALYFCVPLLSLCSWDFDMPLQTTLDSKDENDKINGADFPDGATKFTFKRVTD